MHKHKTRSFTYKGSGTPAGDGTRWESAHRRTGREGGRDLAEECRGVGDVLQGESGEWRWQRAYVRKRKMCANFLADDGAAEWSEVCIFYR